jgi:hypothetical protein
MLWYVSKNIKNDITIMAVKKPSYIKKVDYKQIVDDLYNSKISDNTEEDKYIKKIIPNINFGLLEKSWNKKLIPIHLRP